MGEVYRTTDSNLKRSAALKVLPPSITGDADRLARFQREAEVLAALNHPNIAAIYGLELLLAMGSSSAMRQHMTSHRWRMPQLLLACGRSSCRIGPSCRELAPSAGEIFRASARHAVVTGRETGRIPRVPFRSPWQTVCVTRMA